MALKSALIATAALFTTTLPAAAQSAAGWGWSWSWAWGWGSGPSQGGHHGSTPPATTVPEIDVTSSALAVAAVLAALAFTWERSRRRAH